MLSMCVSIDTNGSSNTDIVAILKSFPEVTGTYFGDKEISCNYGIIGHMAQLICDYFDKEYITDEDIVGDVLISCPYAVSFYDKHEIKDLEL